MACINDIHSFKIVSFSEHQYIKKFTWKVVCRILKIILQIILRLWVFFNKYICKEAHIKNKRNKKIILHSFKIISFID